MRTFFVIIPMKPTFRNLFCSFKNYISPVVTPVFWFIYRLLLTCCDLWL